MEEFYRIKIGVTGSLNLLQPDKFEIIEVKDHEVVEAILVNKRILKRISQATVLKIFKN